MREFAFDVKMWAVIRVKADSEEAARKLIEDHLDCANANLGAWPNGDPIVCEMSPEGDHDLIEIDGEAV